MIHFNKIVFIFITIFCLQGTKGDDQTELKIKQYISNIKSIAAEFEQTDSKGSTAKGLLIIDKPYKFRCNYFAPFPLLIVGNKNYVSVYDYEMEHLSRIKAEENIFYFLLAGKVDFDNKFEVIAAEDLGNAYQIKLSHHDLGRTSQILFDKQTGNIKSMQIFEENNVITVNFSRIQVIKDVDPSLFLLQDPDVFGEPPRLGKAEIEKKYKLAS